MFWRYLARQRRALALGGGCAAIGGAIALLYGLPAEPVLYAAALMLALALGWLAHGYVNWAERCRLLQTLLRTGFETLPPLPPPTDDLEAAYQQLLQQVSVEAAHLTGRAEATRRDLLDYYTVWVHQIKTPLTALDLLLQQIPTDREAASAELLKVEQYAEMALCYLRLENTGHDLVLRRQPLDDIVRATLRRLARLFSQKRISLQLTPTGRQLVTDEKWLGFVLEQLLTNALKYTPPGGQITVAPCQGGLTIADTGLGIRPEDLPRLGEKGFTGANGRLDKRATGLGLYLCRQALGLLGHQMQITSTLGQGTTVTLYLSDEQHVYE